MRRYRILALSLLVALFCIRVEAQQAGSQDVIYLKNGNIVRGTITERIPGERVTIETRDGSVFTFKFEEIERITREKAAGPVTTPGSLPGVQKKQVMDQRWSVGVGLEGGIPTGDFSDISNFGIGGLAWGGYSVDPNLTITAKSGYVHFGGKDFNVSGTTVKTAYGIIPIVVGGRYYFTPSGETRVYGGADVGLYLLNASASTTVSGITVSASENTSKFGFSPVLGVTMKAGEKKAVDIHGNFSYVATEGSSLTWIGFGVGLQFDLK
jgi:opacity protein-like surface antigen